MPEEGYVPERKLVAQFERENKAQDKTREITKEFFYLFQTVTEE